ncbi:uncharacterized protein MELLADRAFT_85105 [Melampsora larici-populina 98AG31]|uniref:Tet-like 2OG-Fe(II) oxygenase domain-containing protein n=1 Tax=Melampsora larici-populina (strain 98AG31 / pathotype 3-4-7) TaxID=747676 RepID=F4SCV6_MELLP|nr:uncharacterized protein MELLADRAFT_85105 [Melampsora larici-populina 98AG31]EGF97517.1 hypothetical protein MELLADRAFT_85105 [Melampsora larici-populina 98AG31]
MTTEQRNDHEKDVTTILMATKLFKKLPTPCRPKSLTVPPPPFALASTVPAGRDDFTMDLSRSLMDPTLPRCLLPHEPADSEPTSPMSSPLSSLGSSPLSSVPPSDSEVGDLGELMDLDSSPLSSLPPSDSEDMDMIDMNMEARHMIPLADSAKVEAKKRKPTTNGALIAGKMYCFGQTVGYSSDILISPYIPVKGSSKRLYKRFLHNLPGFGARIGSRFRNFCDQLKFQPSGPLDFAANFAFTLCGFYNKPHTDNDKGKVYCLWYPIDSESGKIVTKIEGYYYEGGWFIFPEYGLAFNLGSKYAVQIAWNGKTTFHHTLPSKEKDDVDQAGKKIHYTRLGCSSQITQKMARACAKAGTKDQFNYRSNYRKWKE